MGKMLTAAELRERNRAAAETDPAAKPAKADTAARAAKADTAKAAPARKPAPPAPTGRAEGDRVELTFKLETVDRNPDGLIVHRGHADGRAVAYKGSKQLGNPGDTITVRATIKKYGPTETVIVRPQVVSPGGDNGDNGGGAGE